MKVTKENLNLENGLKKEWLITNGLGGFASSTIIRNKHKKISWFTYCTTNTTCKKIFNIIQTRRKYKNWK